MSMQSNSSGPDQATRRSQALGRFVAAAQADAERFHGNAAPRAWQPRGTPLRRSAAKQMLLRAVALALSVTAVAACVYQVLSSDAAASASAPVAVAPRAEAPWFATLARGDDVTPAAAARVAAAPDLPAVPQAPPQPPAVADDSLPVAPMNVPTPPDDMAAANDPAQTGYDMGDGAPSHDEPAP